MALNQTFNQDSAGDIGAAGSVTTGLPTYVTGTYNALSLGLTGLLRVDGSNVTQPISATTLPLPTGAATSALQTAGNTTLTTISGQLPAVLGPTTMAGSLSVTIATNQTAIPVTVSGSVSPLTSSTGTITSVAASTSSTVLLAANAASKGFIIFNDSLNIMYLAFSATASTTAFSAKVQAGAAYNSDAVPLYNGTISAVWSAASGNARITAFT